MTHKCWYSYAFLLYNFSVFWVVIFFYLVHGYHACESFHVIKQHLTLMPACWPGLMLYSVCISMAIFRMHTMCHSYTAHAVFSCDTLRDISSGRVVLTGTTVGSTATYSCNKGYILVGDQTRTCQFDGEWTGREPYCQRKDSLCISLLHNILWYSYGWVLLLYYYICLKFSIPLYLVLRCKELQDISSGRVVLSGTTVGSTATYSCNKGYVLYGEQTRICLPDGEWSGEEPFCERKKFTDSGSA